MSRQIMRHKLINEQTNKEIKSNPPKYYRVHFMLAWGLPLRVVYIPSETPLEKIIFYL